MFFLSPADRAALSDDAATPRTHQSDPHPCVPTVYQDGAHTSQPYAPLETQSDLQGYAGHAVPYVPGRLIGPRAVSQAQEIVQRQEEHEFAEPLDDADGAKPPTEAGSTVQATEPDSVPIRFRDAILRSASSKLSALVAAAGAAERNEILANLAAAMLLSGSETALSQPAAAPVGEPAVPSSPTEMPERTPDDEPGSACGGSSQQ